MSDGPSRPDPVLDVRRTAGGFVACGEASVELGHRLPSTTGHARADGVWAGWHWDGSTLTAETDRYALVPIFWHATGSRLLVSTSLPALVRAGAPAALDRDALATFAALGVFLGETTPFAGIRTVPPDGVLVWDGAPDVTGRRTGGPAMLAIDREEALDLFAERLRDAVWRRVADHGPVTLPLSGGRDSRHLLLALCELGRPPRRCVTTTMHPPNDSLDVEVAARLCRRLGIPHDVVPQPPRLPAEVRKNEACNLLADENAWFVAVADRVRREPGVTLHGLAGDVLAGSYMQRPEWLALYRAGRLEDLAGQMLARGGQPTGRTTAPFVTDGAARRRVRERIVEELAQHAEAPNPVTMTYFWCATAREQAAMATRMLDPARCFLPYLDHAVFDLLAALPPELTADRRFQTDAIARAYPHVADVPYSAGAAKRLVTAHYLRLAVDVGRYGIARDPARAPAYLASLAGMAAAAARPFPRPRHEVPEWILYRWQLEDLVREAAG